jgi:hypothetical protein
LTLRYQLLPLLQPHCSAAYDFFVGACALAQVAHCLHLAAVLLQQQLPLQNFAGAAAPMLPAANEWAGAHLAGLQLPPCMERASAHRQSCAVLLQGLSAVLM